MLNRMHAYMNGFSNAPKNSNKSDIEDSLAISLIPLKNLKEK